MSTRKTRIALFGNPYQERKSAAVQKFFSVIADREVELLISKLFYSFLLDGLQINVPECEIIENDDFTADVVVCMGGDGTFLDVASRVGNKEIPILGINTGRLGFLASFSPEHIEQMVDSLIDGSYSVEDRSVLQITCDEMPMCEYPYALNEIAVLKHDISSMISIHTTINGEYLTTYLADGLIIGTPTGSTAYSLSVGGPIIVPQSDTIQLTPVAPHSLNMRPIVLCDDSEVMIRVESRSHNFLVSLDGRSQSYNEGLHMRIKKAPYVVKVVTRPGQSFFSTMRKKMKLGSDYRG